MEINGLQELIDALGEIPQQARDAVNAGISRCTVRVWKEAILNAPRSPTTQQQARASRKTRQNTSGRRKPTAFTRAKPGGLERSISMEMDKKEMAGSVFVAANSEAGKYAKKIHDEKGESWHNRGPGTIAKGQRADAKFIERALAENEDKVDVIINEELGKVKL